MIGLIRPIWNGLGLVLEHGLGEHHSLLGDPVRLLLPPSRRGCAINSHGARFDRFLRRHRMVHRREHGAKQHNHDGNQHRWPHRPLIEPEHVPIGYRNSHQRLIYNDGVTVVVGNVCATFPPPCEPQANAEQWLDLWRPPGTVHAG